LTASLKVTPRLLGIKGQNLRLQTRKYKNTLNSKYSASTWLILKQSHRRKIDPSQR